MVKNRFAFVASILVMFFIFMGVMAPGVSAKTLYIGGTMALTGAYAEDTAAVLAGYEDYAQYLNDTKTMAPWLNFKIPNDITFEVL